MHFQAIITAHFLTLCLTFVETNVIYVSIKYTNVILLSFIGKLLIFELIFKETI